MLPVFGLRSAIPAEREIFVVPDGERAAVFDESLQLLRSVLEQDDVDVRGRLLHGELRRMSHRDRSSRWTSGSAGPRPPRSAASADSATAGSAASSLRQEARRGREQIQRAAAEAGREIEPDHFGINLAVSDGELPDELAAAVKRRRPDVDPTELIADSWPQLHRQLDAYVDAGLTKFVIRPARQARIDRLHRSVCGRTGPAAELTSSYSSAIRSRNQSLPAI